MTENRLEFNFTLALKGLQEGKSLMGNDGILTPLIEQLTEAALEAELDSHLESPPISVQSFW